MILLLSNAWTQRLVFDPVISDGLIEAWRQKKVYGKYIQMPSMIIPSQAQNEAIAFIRNEIPESRVFYVLGYHNGEITPQTGRIHYPLNRRTYVDAHPADIVLIGPSVISPWKDPIQREELIKLVARECPRPAIKNDFYMICPIAENLSRP